MLQKVSMTNELGFDGAQWLEHQLLGFNDREVLGYFDQINVHKLSKDLQWQFASGKDFDFQKFLDDHPKAYIAKMDEVDEKMDENEKIIT